MLFPSFIGLLAISWGFSSGEPQVEYSAEQQANFYVLAQFIIIDRLIKAYNSPDKALSNTILNEAVKEFRVELCDDIYYVWKRQSYTLLAVFDREQYQELAQQVDAVSKSSLNYVFSALVGFEGFPVTEYLTEDYDIRISTLLEYIRVQGSPKFLLNLRGFIHLKNLPHTSLSKINVDKSPIKHYLLQPELTDVVDLLIQDSTLLKQAHELYGPQDSVKFVNEAQYFIGDLSRLVVVHKGIKCILDKTKTKVTNDCSMKLHFPAVSYDGLINSPWPACISVCDDYSLPIDFVKKRPSSFDPCLAETIPDNWAAPSPLSEHVSFLDPPVTQATSAPLLQQPQQLQQQHHHHHQQQVKLVEGYSDPKDSKRFPRTHRKNRKDKKSNYSSDSSAPKSSADEDNQLSKVPELNSPDSISEDLVRPLQSHKSPKRLTGPDTSKRNPSPYYYSDLLKSKENKEETKESKLKTRLSTASEPAQPTSTSNPSLVYKKSSSLDVPEVEREFQQPKRYSITEDGVRIIRCDSPSTTTSDDSDCSECQKRREWHAKALALVRETCNINSESVDKSAAEKIAPNPNNPSMPPHRLLGPAVCACAAPALGDDLDEFFRPRSIFYVHQQGVHECADCTTTTVGSDKSTNTELHEDEMSSGRTRQIYETAFDSKISRSDDDLDEVDRLTNHSVLLQINNGNSGNAKTPKERSKSSKSRLEVKRLKNSKNQAIQDNGGSVSALSNDLENVHIDNNLDNMNNANTTSTSQLPIRGYTPSPPSTAPLPVKFPGKHDRFFMNSIKSAPNLPSSNPAHPRLRDLRLPVKTMRHQHDGPTGSDGSMVEGSYNPPRSHDRPRSVVLESGRVLELRKSHHGHHQRGRNYSSTESMATSSSGGSMESLRSSTSEGNRSTTSSESRHSTSLSSHSSDSGQSLAFPLRAPVVIHSKLHILSPISDKSSQEPASEASEINRNNNSQKQSPVDAIKGSGGTHPDDQQITNEGSVKQPKRRTLPNKTLLHLTDEILGSDSGISLHSREDGKSQSAFHKFALPKLNFPADKPDGGAGGTGLPQDLRDLPFDMPKLRRRKVVLQQDACTSGSATSVDLGDLPFDMPKLRRRLRMNQPQTTNLVVHSTESSGMSQASSSHSVREDNKALAGIDTGIFRQNLTLNLNEPKAPNKFGSLDLKGASSRGLNLNLGSGAFTAAVDMIDVSVPLDRQGWYHGAITRIEAESTLRPLSEGSFLVRNCESTKQDYSLSLKSAKGFMHMRIQRNDSGQYILGQFSRPFESVPEMIRHFCLNRLPVRGAEHMCLLDPVIAQLL